jgi:DivIVA domain-containing protein
VALVIAVLVGIAALGGLALALSLVDRGLEDEPVDHPDLGVPDRTLRADDVSGLRFRIGWRGYRMEDVDSALDRLAQSMRDAETGSET